MQETRLIIRPLEQGDIPGIAQAFQNLDWNKPVSHYERYFVEQAHGMRDVFVAFLDGKLAGYLTICWSSTYPPFCEAGIPEIVDFNVLPPYRRQGIGTALMEKAENEIAKQSRIAGIGVGMDSDYGAAQRLYVLRGYVPDGHGLYYRGHFPKHGEHVTVDDDLALYFTKALKLFDGNVVSEG